VDIKSEEARSENMAKIRLKDTKPEIFIRSALFSRNFRYRVNYKAVEGHPDIYFTRAKVAIFIHGCYWHRHDGCKFAYVPKSNSDFWLTKFESNTKRDSTVCEALLSAGIRVLIVWECTIRKMKRNTKFYEDSLECIERFISEQNQQFAEI